MSKDYDTPSRGEVQEMVNNYLVAIRYLDDVLTGEEEKSLQEIHDSGMSDFELVQGLAILSGALARSIARSKGTDMRSILEILRKTALQADID